VNGPNWLSSVSSVTAPSPDTVLIKTSEPNDSLPFLLSQRLLMGSIIAPKGVSDPILLKTESLGVGPYVLDQSQTVANNTYVYVPNKSYWDQSKIRYQKVVIKVVPSMASALQGLEAGEIDIFMGNSPTAQAAAKSSLGVAAAQFAVFGVNYGDRTGSIVPALAKVPVRQALSYAINRPQIAKAVYGPYGAASATPTVQGYAGYSPANATAYTYDPAKAKQLLTAAGYQHGFSFNMATTTKADANLMAQAVVQDWAAIGVQAKLTTYTDDNQLISDILAHKYPVTVYAYGALPQYIQAKSFFTGGQTQYNPWNSQDPQLKADLTKAAESSTATQQDMHYQQALQRATVSLAWLSNVFSSAAPIIYNNKTVAGVTISSTVPTPDVAWAVHPIR
jgi:peptide/nickel transport system substrate-binding protein